jgi:hypothetical protein
MSGLSQPLVGKAGGDIESSGAEQLVQAETASPVQLRSEANHAGSAGLSFVVSTVTGQQFSVIAAGTDSVVAIKRHILRQAGIPMEAQRIVRAGVELEDTQTLGGCGVADKESLHLMLKLTAEEARAGEAMDPALADMMQRHGLTEAEQWQLHGENVVDVETFASLRDEDFQFSGIDIRARRQEKLQRDQEKATATHALAMMRQVQGLLDDAGLSHAGRECARSLSEVSALRALDLQGMKDLGLSIVDRRKLDAFRQTERVRNVEDVEMEEVMTEPERQRRAVAADAEKQRQAVAAAAEQEQRQSKCSSKACCIYLTANIVMAVAICHVTLIAILVAIALLSGWDEPPLSPNTESPNTESPNTESWRYGAPGEACSAVCSSAGMGCEDGDWGVHDEQSMRAALEAAWQSVDAVCTRGFYSSSYLTSPKVYEYYGECYYMEGSESTSCSATSSGNRRLCRCV